MVLEEAHGSAMLGVLHVGPCGSAHYLDHHLVLSEEVLSLGGVQPLDDQEEEAGQVKGQKEVFGLVALQDEGEEEIFAGQDPILQVEVP